jgi:hypothetical protein
MNREMNGRRRLTVTGPILRKLSVSLALVAALFALAVPAFARTVPDAIWSDGRLFGTVITPTSLPDQGSFDKLYNFGMSGLDGQRSISESKPGDQDFNGGRWEVYLVTYTPAGTEHFDPDGDGTVNYELKSDGALMEAVAAGYLTIGSEVVQRFVCTLIPQT